jgi:REP element-mobilizing transposase RayT
MRKCAAISHYLRMSRLPHVYPESKWLFLTWSLHGVLRPAQFPPAQKVSAGQAFVYMDRYLDRARSGPMFLRQQSIAELFLNSLFRGAAIGHYQTGPFAVMPNHVHVLLMPQIPPSQLLHGLNGVTARDANLLLDRTGEPFWQRESYDHWVRNKDEWARIRAYIENNPVKAGLVNQPEEYLWSSAHTNWHARVTRMV